MLVRLCGPDYHVPAVWELVLESFALTDELLSSGRCLDVKSKLVLRFVQVVGAKCRFISVMNDLVRAMFAGTSTGQRHGLPECR